MYLFIEARNITKISIIMKTKKYQSEGGPRKMAKFANLLIIDFFIFIYAKYCIKIAF
jgi:hypothetical protein